MKPFFAKKGKRRIKRVFFVFVATLCFCYSIFPFFETAVASLSVNEQIFISEDTRVEMEAESHEVTKEEGLEYDRQPETIGEVQGWIDRYLDSGNDVSEKPNWEEEVDEELMPDGWKCDFVEDGDEYFAADYYTIFLDYNPQPEKIEAVRGWIKSYIDSDKDPSEKPNWEKEVDESLMPSGWEIEFVEGGDEYFEADYYTILLVYDPQPEAIEEVQGWIDRYEESNNDASEKPNWEKEVDENLMPDGWYNDLVEGGDEHFEADYYTIFQEEEPEEVVEEPEEELDGKEETEEPEEEVAEEDALEEAFEYDSQPETMEDVQEWVDKFVESNHSRSVKPHWEFDVEEVLMPDGWKTDFVEGGGEFFGLDYYTIFPDVMMARANFGVTNEEEFSKAIEEINSGISGETHIINIQNDIELTQMYTIRNAVNVTITSDGGPFTITRTNVTTSDHENDTSRHLKVEDGVNLTLSNITIDGRTEGGGIELSEVSTLTVAAGAKIQNCFHADDGGGVALYKSMLVLDGGTISNNTTNLSAGGVLVADGSIFTMNSGNIDNNSTKGPGVDINPDYSNYNYFSVGGGVKVVNKSTFTMLGGTISGNESWHHGGGVHVQGGELGPSTFTMESINGTNPTIASNTSNYAGGGVYVGHQNFMVGTNPATMDNSTFVMNGGTIERNDTIYASEVDRRFLYGGGVHVDKGHFKMFDGEISNNVSAFCGGGVSIASSTFTMEGGYISGNMTDIERNREGLTGSEKLTYGGGVWVGRSYYRADSDKVPLSEFNMSGGTIGGNDFHTGDSSDNNSTNGNYASESGGGVYISRGVTFNMYGTAKIAYNHTDNRGGGVYASWGSDWSASYPSGGAKREPSAFNLNGNEEGALEGAPEISNNKAERAGGGVYVAEKTKFNMYPGTKITGNSTNDRGGGVTVLQSYFYMHGGEISSNSSKERGGGVTVVCGIFEMYGGDITNNKTTNVAGGVHVGKTVADDLNFDETKTPKELTDPDEINATSYFLLDGGTIQENTADKSGGGVTVMYGSKFEMKAGAISENKTNEFAGGVAVQQSYFTMTGGNITDNTSYYNGGGVTVESAIFKMSGGTISSNETTWVQYDSNPDDGIDIIEDGAGAGGVWVAKLTTNYDEAIAPTEVVENGGISFFYMSGTSEISDNIAKASGGGVSVEDGSLFEMNAGTIESNTTEDAGGGVNVQQNSKFNMKGGTIKGNRSQFTGAGVYVIDTHRYDPEQDLGPSIFNMSGGTIEDNETTSTVGLDQAGAAAAGVENLANGGGVAIIRSHFNMNGDENGPFSENNPGTPTINKNIAKHIGGGVFADDGSIVYMYDGAVISNNKTETWDGGILIHWNSVFYMEGGEITNNTSVFNGGGVGIISSEFYMSDGTISGNTTTSLIDSTGGGVMVGKSDIRGDYEIPGYFKMTGGTISRNRAVNSGGGVSIEDGSEFEMSGGTIGGSSATDANTTTDRGGGVYLQAGSTFTMTGGTISSNNATYDGGGVYLTSDSNAMYPNTEPSIFNMKGGYITGNSTHLRGGGVGLTAASKFNMASGTISNNSAVGNNACFGGGVYLEESSTFIMSGDAHIDSNMLGNDSQGGGGAGVYNIDSIFTMNAGTISNNNALQQSENNSGGSGGGVYTTATYGGNTYAKFTMNGGTISGNIGIHGGGVRVYGTTFEMNGGEIRENTSRFNNAGGGGVSIGSDSKGDYPSTFTMNGGFISENTAANVGGGVNDNGTDTNFTMNGGIISANTALSGGGVNIDDGTNCVFTINAGTITGNTASESDGGGIYVGSNSKVVISGTGKTYITHNWAATDGGGIYTDTWNSDYEGLSTPENVEFTGNHAENGAYKFTGSMYDNIKSALAVSIRFPDQTAALERYPINNYDINYKNTTNANIYLITFHSNNANVDPTTPETKQYIHLVEGQTMESLGYYYDQDTHQIKDLENGVVIVRVDIPVISSGFSLIGWDQDPDVKLQDPNLQSMWDAQKVLTGNNSSLVKDYYAAWTNNFEFIKVDMETQEPIEGVEFKLYKSNERETVDDIELTTDNPDKWEEFGTGSYTSDDNGLVSIETLGDGTYQLVEISTLDGYCLPTGQWRIKVEDVVITTSRIAGKDGVEPPELQEDTANAGRFILGNVPLTTDFTFVKVDSANTGTVLEGAEFQLYYKDDGKKYYYSKDDDGTVEWIEEGAANPGAIITGNEGTYAFTKLGSGTYCLVEMKAPKGYQLPTGYWEITIDMSEGGVTDIQAVADEGGTVPPGFKEVSAGENTSYQLGNIKSFTLPESGNNGIQWFILLGLLLLAAGTARIVYKKQSSPS